MVIRRSLVAVALLPLWLSVLDASESPARDWRIEVFDRAQAIRAEHYRKVEGLFIQFAAETKEYCTVFYGGIAEHMKLERIAFEFRLEHEPAKISWRNPWGDWMTTEIPNGISEELRSTNPDFRDTYNDFMRTRTAVRNAKSAIVALYNRTHNEHKDAFDRLEFEMMGRLQDLQKEIDERQARGR